MGTLRETTAMNFDSRFACEKSCCFTFVFVPLIFYVFVINLYDNINDLVAIPLKEN